jgi:protein tyrosine phosphatase (PTP) superfamily phosphohydrolase (DUF442 family)
MTSRSSFRPRSATVLLVLGLLAVSPLMAQAPAPAVQPAAPLLANEHHPLPEIATGGAPASAEGFQALARAGYRTFVDLRSDAEVTPEIQAAAEAAGLHYRRIPITRDEDLHLGTARALAALLDERSNYPVAIACASGNRVGALLAVKAFWLDGASSEEALALGLRAGLTRLEPSVRSLLGLPPAKLAPRNRPGSR